MAVAYLMGVPGMIKVAEEVLNFIAFLCIACHSWITEKGEAFLVASLGAFIFTAILIIVYILEVNEKLVIVPWVKVQFFYCVIWGLFYFIASALVIDEGIAVDDSYIAGGVFGLFASIVYFVDAFFKYHKQM